MDILTGSGARKKLEEDRQNRSLAEFARQQAETDQVAASRFRRRGQGLLTYLKNTGETKLGGSAK